MRLCIAQLKPFAGDIEANLDKHDALVDLAISCQADLICFPELSLTGYEPKLAKQLATHPADLRLSRLQSRADAQSAAIAVGLPTPAQSGLNISLILFQPGQPPVVYAKQQLHEDELPYFVPGEQQILLRSSGHGIAPAICYESLQASHAANAAALGADIYLASVAKSAQGIAKANLHYPAIAQRHAMTVLMANCIGPCDDFLAAGQSAIWNARGDLLTRLEADREGVALLDTATQQASVHYLATQQAYGASSHGSR